MSVHVLEQPRPVWPDLIAELEGLLEQAKRGDVLALSYVAEHPGGAMSYTAMHNVGSCHLKMIGQLQELSRIIGENNRDVQD